MSTSKKWGKRVFEDFLKRSESTEGSICKFKDQITFGTNPNDVPLRRERVYERTVYKISKTDQKFSKPQTKNEDGKGESVETTSDRHQLLAEIEKNLKNLHDQKKFLMANDSKQKRTWSEHLSKDYSEKHKKKSCRKDCDHIGDSNICSVLQKFLEKNCVKVADSSTQIGSSVRQKIRLSSKDTKKDWTSNDLASSSLDDNERRPRKEGGVNTVNSGTQVKVSHFQNKKKKRPNDRPQQRINPTSSLKNKQKNHGRNSTGPFHNSPYTDFTSESLIKNKSWLEKEVKTKTIYRKNIFTSPRNVFSSNEKSPRTNIQSSARSSRILKEEINQTLFRSGKISKKVTNSIESLYQEEMQSPRTPVNTRKSSRASRDFDSQNRRRRRSKSQSLTTKSSQPLERPRSTKDQSLYSERHWTLQHSQASFQSPRIIMQRALQQIAKVERLKNIKDTIERHRFESDNNSDLIKNSANENIEDAKSSFSEYHHRSSKTNSNVGLPQTLNFVRPGVIDDNTYTLPKDDENKDYIILPYNRITVGIEVSTNKTRLKFGKKVASVEPILNSPQPYQKHYVEQRGSMPETLRQSLQRESRTSKLSPTRTYYRKASKAKSPRSQLMSLQTSESENKSLSLKSVNVESESSTSTRLSLQNQIRKSCPESIAPTGFKSNQLQEEAVEASSRLSTTNGSKSKPLENVSNHIRKSRPDSIAPSGFKSDQIQEKAVNPSNRFSRPTGSMPKPFENASNQIRKSQPESIVPSGFESDQLQKEAVESSNRFSRPTGSIPKPSEKVSNQIRKSHLDSMVASGAKPDQLQEEAVVPSNRFSTPTSSMSQPYENALNQIRKSHPESIVPSDFKSDQLQEEAVESSNRFSRPTGSMPKPFENASNQIRKSHPESIVPIDDFESDQLQEEAVEPSNRLSRPTGSMPKPFENASNEIRKSHPESIPFIGFKSNQLQEEAEEASDRLSRTNGSMPKSFQSVPIESETSGKMSKNDAISPEPHKKNSTLRESYNISLISASSSKPSGQRDKSMTDIPLELNKKYNDENNFRANASVSSTYPKKNGLNSDRNSGYQNIVLTRDCLPSEQQNARKDQSDRKSSSQYNSETRTPTPHFLNEFHTVDLPSSKNPLYISESANTSCKTSEELERPNEGIASSSNSSQYYFLESLEADVPSNRYELSYETGSSDPLNKSKCPPQYAAPVQDSERNGNTCSAAESAETKIGTMSTDWKTQAYAQNTLMSDNLDQYEPLPEPRNSLLRDSQSERHKTISLDSLDAGLGRKSEKSEHSSVKRSLKCPRSNEPVSLKDRSESIKVESPKAQVSQMARNNSSGKTSAKLLVGFTNGSDESSTLKDCSEKKPLTNTVLMKQDHLQNLPTQSFSKNNPSILSSRRELSVDQRRRSSSLPHRSKEYISQTEPARSVTESIQSSSLPRYSTVFKSKTDRVSNNIVESGAFKTSSSLESNQNYGSKTWSPDRTKSSAMSSQLPLEKSNAKHLPKTCASLESLENQRFINKDFSINEPNKISSREVLDKKNGLKSIVSEGSISTFPFNATFSKNYHNTKQTTPCPAHKIEVESAKSSKLRTEGSLATTRPENVFLSDSQNLNARIEGIDSEMQNFIQYLQNRLRDCDKMVKLQLDLQAEVASRLNENRANVERTDRHEVSDKKGASKSFAFERNSSANCFNATCSKNNLNIEQTTQNSAHNIECENEEYSDLKTESSLAITSQEDEFLSESQTQYAHIKGIDSELQNFIQYLQNRLRDCDKVVKKQLAKQAHIVRKLKESRAQVEVKGHFEEVAIVSEEKFDSDSTEVSELAANREYRFSMNEQQKCTDRPSESEHSFEYRSCEQDYQTLDHIKIPHFLGCDCMKEDYYRIMRLAYCKE